MRDQYLSAKLSIPFGSSLPKEVRWRLKLIKRHSNVATPPIAEGLLKKTNRTLTFKEKNSFLNLLNSEDLHLDEVDQAILFFTFLCQNQDRLKDDQVNSLLNSTRVNLHSLGRNLLKKEIPRIRAKYAVLEVLAVIIGPDAIPRILSQSKKYLSWPVISDWLRKNQVDRIFGQGKIKQSATRQYETFEQVLRGNTKQKKRTYPHWAAYFKKESLAEGVHRLRLYSQKNGIDLKLISDFRKTWKIPDKMKGLLLSNTIGPNDFALEVMTLKKEIRSPKALLDIQAALRRLIFKHETLVQLSEIQKILDLSKLSPSLFLKIDTDNIIESIDISDLLTTPHS